MIKRLKESYSVVMCKVFNVHRSSYRTWFNRPKQRSVKKVKELAIVGIIHRESNCSAGARTIASISTQRGLTLSRYHSGYLMKQLEIVSCQLPGHRYKKATQEDIAIPNYLHATLMLISQPKFSTVMLLTSGQEKDGLI